MYIEFYIQDSMLLTLKFRFLCWVLKLKLNVVLTNLIYSNSMCSILLLLSSIRLFLHKLFFILCTKSYIELSAWKFNILSPFLYSSFDVTETKFAVSMWDATADKFHLLEFYVIALLVIQNFMILSLRFFVFFLIKAFSLSFVVNPI